MATPKSVSAADLVPHSKLKVVILSPHESDGTGLLGQVGLRLDEIPAAPTAVGVAIGVAPRHATDLSPCQRYIWGLFCPSLFAAVLTLTTFIPDLATIPVWPSLLCRLISCCLCCAAILYYATALQRGFTATFPLGLRLLWLFTIVGISFICFISAANFCIELERNRWDQPTAGTTAGVLLVVGVGLNVFPYFFICCLKTREAWLPTFCLETDFCLELGCPPSAEETKAPLVTVAVRH
eukprot:scaffold22267_cov64-Phaeocystis_antarctica.AAC.3